MLEGDALPLLTEILDPIAIIPNRAELLRYVGYPATASPVRPIPAEVEHHLALGLSRLRPKATYSIYRVQGCADHELTIGDVIVRGKVAEFLAPADRVAVFVVSAGRLITDESLAWFHAGDIVASWVLDAVGSYAAEAAAEALSQRLRQQFPSAGAVSERFSPGYCGMRVSEQAALFRLIDAKAIGVSLEASMLMQPTKSISGLLGIGSDGAFACDDSPCRRCGDRTCTMRR